MPCDNGDVHDGDLIIDPTVSNIEVPSGNLDIFAMTMEEIDAWVDAMTSEEVDTYIEEQRRKIHGTR